LLLLLLLSPGTGISPRKRKNKDAGPNYLVSNKQEDETAL
jgi:hypothetical protein